MTTSTPITSPAVITYTTLSDELQNYLQRNDELFINNIPNFIYTAEQFLASAVKDLGQLQFATQTGITSQLRKPEGWRSTNSIRITDSTTNKVQVLVERPYQFCHLYQSEIDPNFPIGMPIYYSDYDYNNYFVTPVYPSTAANMQIELAYYAYPKYLSDVNQENYWTMYYPQALLYASLVQACLFTRNDDRAGQFAQLLQTVLGILDVEDNNRIDDSAYAVKGAEQKNPPELKG